MYSARLNSQPQNLNLGELLVRWQRRKQLPQAKATLKASTLILSLVACAVLYFCVARRRRRRSSLLSAPMSLLFSLQSISIHIEMPLPHQFRYGVVRQL
jgi:hypothetical protein